MVLTACGSVELGETTSELVTQPPADDLALWLDASSGVGLFPSGEVWWWEDRSGTGRVLGRGSPDKPSIRVARFPDTDQVGLLFAPDESGDRGYLVNSDFALRPPFTVAMVFHPLPTTSDHWDTPIGGSRAPTVALTKRVDWTLPQTVDLAATSGSSGFSFQYISAPAGWAIRKSAVIATFDGDASAVDVTCETSPLLIGDCAAAHGTLGTYGFDGITLSHGGDRTFHGYIAEILIYRRHLDRLAAAELAAYLTDRYALE